MDDYILNEEDDKVLISVFKNHKKILVGLAIFLVKQEDFNVAVRFNKKKGSYSVNFEVLEE